MRLQDATTHEPRDVPMEDLATQFLLVFDFREHRLPLWQALAEWLRNPGGGNATMWDAVEFGELYNVTEQRLRSTLARFSRQTGDGPGDDSDTAAVD